MLQEIQALTRKLRKLTIFNGANMKAIDADTDTPIYQIDTDTPHIIIEYHGLTATERRHIAEIGTRNAPPKKVGLDGKVDPQDSYDYDDQEYLNKQAEANELQQCLAILYGVPSIREDLHLVTMPADKLVIERAATQIPAHLQTDTIATVAEHILGHAIIGVTHDFFLRNLSKAITSSTSGDESLLPSETKNSTSSSTPPATTSTTPT